MKLFLYVKMRLTKKIKEYANYLRRTRLIGPESNWKKKKIFAVVQSLSPVGLSVTPWTATYQA